MNRTLTVMISLAGMLATTACSDTVIGPSDDPATALMDVVPSHGSVDVSVGTSVVATFDHALGPGMESYAALHEGALTGPIVEGVWVLSEDRTVLTFTPAAPLKAGTVYVIHLGAGMTDVNGHHVSLGQHGTGMGGEWATEGMMSGGMGMGMGTGMGQNGQMMGAGWAHPTNGTYGMVFSFTTAV